MFSEHFKTELDIVDIQTQRVDKFGECLNCHGCGGGGRQCPPLREINTSC